MIQSSKYETFINRVCRLHFIPHKKKNHVKQRIYDSSSGSGTGNETSGVKERSNNPGIHKVKQNVSSTGTHEVKEHVSNIAFHA